MTTRPKVASQPLHSFTADGPLQGPLGPLVTPGRVDLLAATAALDARWGADPDTGTFPCPLPGHTGTALLDIPPDDPHGDLRLLCCSGRWRSLGEVRAAEAYGGDSRRSNIELATWLRRLAWEVGAVTPVPMAMPSVPDGNRPELARALDGFTLLVGLRWRDGQRRPVAFSVRFAAAWCGLGHRAAHLAIGALERHEVIRHVGDAGRVRLYLPGDVAGATVVPLRPTSSEEMCS